MTIDHSLPYRNPNLSLEARVADLLARMILPEKVAQLSAAWLSELSDEAGFSAEKAQARIGAGIGQITGLGSRSPLPPLWMKGFRRVTLAAGEECTVTFTLAVAQLAFYNLEMNYVVEPGKIGVMVGSSSEDIRLKGDFEIVGETTPIARKVFFSQSAVTPAQRD